MPSYFDFKKRFSNIIQWIILICVHSSLLTDAYWGGGRGRGGWGGQFHSGYGLQGHGYGSGICAGARQRQGMGQMEYRQQPISPYSFDGGYNNNNNGYYNSPEPIPQRTMIQQPNMMMSSPMQGSELEYRVNLPVVHTQPTPAPAPCSLPRVRDPKIFQQSCFFPSEKAQYSCSSRGDTFPVGTTSITACKSPHYYSDTGDVMLEVCKDGKWHGDGKILTCKSNVIATQPPVVNTPSRDPVAQYVQQPQVVNQPPVFTNNDVPSAAQDYNSQQNQPYWTYNQPVPPSSNQGVLTYKPNDTQSLPQNWSYTRTTAPPMSPPESYLVKYPSYYTTSSTTTTTEPTTTSTTTTTTTPKPIYENIDWRQYSKTPFPSSNLYYDPSENNKFVSPQNPVNKCPPLISKDGVILECLSKSAQNSNGGNGYYLSISDCQEPQPVGTEATYKCQMYYEPLTGLPTQYRKCKENEVWTGNDDGFGCKLECGKSNPAGRLPLITFGEMTMLGQWPWHAALFIRERGQITNACGGTLVGRKAVLTAAHCVNLYLSSLTRDLNDIRVDLGRYYRNEDDQYVQKFEVEKIITHPAYNPFIFESDIAIIILKDSARIGFHVRPICFPKSQNAAFDEMNLADGSYATVVGWGVDETGESPNELRAAKIQVIGYRECIESFEEADTGALLAKSTTFCAGNKNGTNVCRGDSGSGAYFAVRTSSGSTRWYLQGIVSLGINVSANDKTCDPEKVSIFTRVSPYADWINRVLQENDAM